MIRLANAERRIVEDLASTSLWFCGVWCRTALRIPACATIVTALAACAGSQRAPARWERKRQKLEDAARGGSPASAPRNGTGRIPVLGGWPFVEALGWAFGKAGDLLCLKERRFVVLLADGAPSQVHPGDGLHALRELLRLGASADEERAAGAVGEFVKVLLQVTTREHRHAQNSG
jgi:hypothetical protein